MIVSSAGITAAERGHWVVSTQQSGGPIEQAISLTAPLVKHCKPALGPGATYPRTTW